MSVIGNTNNFIISDANGYHCPILSHQCDEMCYDSKNFNFSTSSQVDIIHKGKKIGSVSSDLLIMISKLYCSLIDDYVDLSEIEVNVGCEKAILDVCSYDRSVIDNNCMYLFPSYFLDYIEVCIFLDIRSPIFPAYVSIDNILSFPDWALVYLVKPKVDIKFHYHESNRGISCVFANNKLKNVGKIVKFAVIMAYSLVFNDLGKTTERDVLDFLGNFQFTFDITYAQWRFRNDTCHSTSDKQTYVKMLLPRIIEKARRNNHIFSPHYLLHHAENVTLSLFISTCCLDITREHKLVLYHIFDIILSDTNESRKITKLLKCNKVFMDIFNEYMTNGELGDIGLLIGEKLK